MRVKKGLFFLAAVALACLLTVASGETALEMTGACAFRLNGKSGSKSLTDKKYTTYQESKSVKNPTLTVESESPMYGLYLCFQKMPEAYEIQVERGGAWETVYRSRDGFHHVYCPLDGVKSLQVIASGDEKQVMGFNEVSVFGQGAVPDWVQRWEPAPEKADLLFVVAHPEEELLYLGGAIPYYARERERSVAVACFSYANTTRRSELLNGLWSMGYRQYPFIGNFKTASAKSVTSAYKNVGKNGEEQVISWLSGIIRQCRPEVVVGPDPEGEGKNGQRMMLADACRQCFQRAANPDDYSGEPWQVKKVYLHLYGDAEEQIVFDWNQPLTRLGGRTGRELAYYAYLFHKTQDDQDKTVFGTGETYANNVFGLCDTLVGMDTERKDFLEHIPAEDLTDSVMPEEMPGWTLAEVPGLPELNGEGFLEEGEFIWSDDAHGHYVYISPTLKLVIQRKFNGALPLTWFETDIQCNLAAGERMRTVEYTPEKPVGKKSRVDAAVNATENRLVFAVNADYYTYRVGSKNGHPVGVEIRDRNVYFDDRYDYVEKKFFPNLDTLAFYEDGSLDVHHSVDLSAQEYLDRGAYLVFSFGPFLVDDNGLSEWVTDPLKSRAKNPRHSFGMIEPGHYVDIMCEGRLGSRSEGVTMPQLAILSRWAGCTEACDLDGGQTAVVIFMGKQLNRIGKYDGKTAARATCEVLAVGTSDQVGTFEVK